MKKNLLLLILLTVSVSINAQYEGSKQMFSAPDLKESISTHKTVAIIPLKASIYYKKMPKGMDAEMVINEEKKMGYDMQGGMYTYLLRKADNYSVGFQEIERTNVLLKKAGFAEKRDEFLPEDLCKILNVDAVIIANYAWSKTGSEAGAIAKSLIFGGLGGGVASGTLTMQIYEAKEGKLLWRFNKEMNEGAFSSANELMERMMRKVSRNFPYEKN
jgi:hypothetical protein